jgi:phage gp36-like protein
MTGFAEVGGNPFREQRQRSIVAYAAVSALREFLGDAFAAVGDSVLEDYLDYASVEIDARLSPYLLETPVDPAPPLLVRLCLYRAAAEVLAVYYGKSGAAVEDGRAERFLADYRELLGLLQRDPALLGVPLAGGRGAPAWFHDDPDSPTLSRFARLSSGPEVD